MHVTYLHLFAINVQGANRKVDPDGVLLLLDEYARLEALDHTGLPHIGVPNQDDFEKKVERVLNLRPCRLHGEGRNVQYTHKNKTKTEDKTLDQDLCASMQQNLFLPSCQ